MDFCLSMLAQNLFRSWNKQQFTDTRQGVKSLFFTKGVLCLAILLTEA